MSRAEKSCAGAVQRFLLVSLRILIGWHFLYEGYVKLTAKSWSALGYLQQAQGPLAGFFHSMAASKQALHVVNLLNAWGLTAVGLGLILGLFTRLSCVGAILMLGMYYLASPPWIAVLPRLTEGNYLLVDKNLVELVACAVLLFSGTGRTAGLDVFYYEWKRRRAAKAASATGATPTEVT